MRTNTSRNIPKLTLLVCLLIAETILGSTVQPKIERPKHDETRTRRHNLKREKEMERIYRSLSKKLEHEESNCKEDQFLSISGSGACESCKKFCDTVNAATCPLKCKVFYLQTANETQAQHIYGNSQTIQELHRANQELINGINEKAGLSLVFAGFGILLLITGLATVSAVVWLLGKMKAMQQTMTEQKIRLEGIAEENRKMKAGLENKTQKEPTSTIQQATPDTTPGSSTQPSPSSTLSRPTTTTEVEEVGQDNGGAVPTTTVGFIQESHGDK